MKEIKKGDNVTRNSYDNDIIFKVDKIIKKSDNIKIAILKGVNIRIEADSPIQDLKRIDKKEKNKSEIELERKIKNNIIKNNYDERIKGIVRTGKILHLDGDKKYAGKSAMYYKNMGLNAIVKNIPENKQSKVIKQLLMIYNPDILVITGHDGMIKNGTGYTDIYNYRNSRYFINTVREARRASQGKDLVIFAGACQSFFEAIMESGANFASSPARVLIDFMDPLIIAEKVAVTPEEKSITINEISNLLNDNNKRIGGRTTRGKKKKYTF